MINSHQYWIDLNDPLKQQDIIEFNEYNSKLSCIRGIDEYLYLSLEYSLWRERYK